MVGGNPRDGRLTGKWIVKGENPAPRHFNPKNIRPELRSPVQQ
jgi:hypothetical protein